jgi:2-polyprenyl-6-methoxyphenol hydroxylase-like FAD-dependent oxidoreductase
VSTVAVSGAGVGGLAAALALQRAGVDVAVYERAETLEPLGAGLSLWPNATRALKALGVELDGGRIPRLGGGVFRWDGKPLATDTPEAIEARYGAPIVVAHRAELQAALLEALAPDTVTTSAPVDAVAQDGDGVEVRGGRFDLFVAADGLNSILAEGPPRPCGLAAYRGVAERDVSDGPVGEFWGPGRVAGVVPLSGGRVYWFATGPADTDERDELGAIFGSWADPVGTVLPAARDVLRHELFDREPDTAWTDGRVTRLGDAAHAMLPFLGQGACQALEDAVALGAAVADHGATPEALAGYERARRPRATMIVKRSRTAARVAHTRLRGPRNFLVGHLPASARHKQLDAVILG